MENSMKVPKNWKTELPYDLAIPLLGMYKKKKKKKKKKQKKINLKRYRHTYFHCNVIHPSQIWKQPKCPSIDEQTKKMWYIYINIYMHICKRILLSHKKEWNLAIYNNMDSSWGDYTMWNKSDWERQIFISFLCGI